MLVIVGYLIVVGSVFGGFLLAGTSPWIVAALRDQSGSFAAGWLMHLGCVALVALLSLRLVPHSYARSMNVRVGREPLGARPWTK